MSTTTTTTSTTAPKTTTLVGMLPGAISTAAAAAAPGFEDHCASCGEKGFMSQGHYHSPEDTQRRIKELESQVQFFQVQTSGAGENILFFFFYSMISKLTVTAGKLAEYDEEIRRLRSQTNGAYTPRTSQSSAASNEIDKSLSPAQLPKSNGSAAPPPAAPPAPLQPQQSQSRLFTLTSFLPYGRRPSATPPAQQQQQQPPPAPPSSHQVPIVHPHPGPDPEETMQLQNALNHEQRLRKAAENQLSQANTELEDLTAQLFSQANEMVAQERKARARLEERVAVLERRDVEKRKRLDRLEKAMERVERLRALVR